MVGGGGAIVIQSKLKSIVSSHMVMRRSAMPSHSRDLL